MHLGCSTATVNTRIQNARRRLARTLRQTLWAFPINKTWVYESLSEARASG